MCDVGALDVGHVFTLQDTNLQGALCWALSVGESEMFYCTFTFGLCPLPGLQ